MLTVGVGERDLPKHGARIVLRHAMAVPGHPSTARGGRGVPGASVRGYESVCYTCEEGYDHAEGLPIGEAD